MMRIDLGPIDEEEAEELTAKDILPPIVLSGVLLLPAYGFAKLLSRSSDPAAAQAGEAFQFVTLALLVILVFQIVIVIAIAAATVLGSAADTDHETETENEIEGESP